MSIIKLEPGDKVLFAVASVEEVAGKFGQQYKFTAVNSDVFFLNVDTAVKQLGRIGYTPQTVVGQTVEFERIAKDGTKYTNINKPGAAKLAASTEKVAHSSGPHIPGIDGPYQDDAPESGTVFPRIAKALELYTVCFDHAHSLAAKAYGNDESHEATAAMAATLYIQFGQRGLLA